MCHTNLVTELSQLPQSSGSLAELHPGFEAYGVDHKVGMDVFRVAVCGHLHFMSWPGLGGKFQTDGVGQCICNFLPGRKGLHILVEIDAVQLVKGSLGGQKFREGIGTITV